MTAGKTARATGRSTGGALPGRGKPASAPTVGVEEEFALLDPRTGHVALVAADVIRGCRDPDGVIAESMTYMVETRTPVCSSLEEVTCSLVASRARVAAEADRRGSVLVASGVAPYGVPDPPPVTAHPRYQDLAARFPVAMRTTGTCACHVHVGVPDRAAGVEVLLRLRPWLPALSALTGNSPIWRGRDVGLASTRHVFAARWPTTTPAPAVTTTTEYDDAVRQAVAAGEALDQRNVYYLARLSPRYPTVEVRLADTCLSLDESVAYTGLVRALVARALEDAERGCPAPGVPQEALRSAWRAAARVGLAGRVLDVLAGREVRTWDLVDALVAHALPHLERYGDTGRVLATLYRMRLVGGGAERQRRMFAEAATPTRFVSALAEATTGRLRSSTAPPPDAGDGGRAGRNGAAGSLSSVVDDVQRT